MTLIQVGHSQADALYVTDPAALHAILVRDQNIFQESTEFAGYCSSSLFLIHPADMFSPVSSASFIMVMESRPYGVRLFLNIHPLFLMKVMQETSTRNRGNSWIPFSPLLVLQNLHPCFTKLPTRLLPPFVHLVAKSLILYHSYDPPWRMKFRQRDARLTFWTL